MRASRLLSIQILLQLRGQQTAEALAEEFEVSVRTIYRDIDALSAAGIPVYADRGPGGGFALLDGYRTRLTGLASAESEALLMIGLLDQARALGLGDAAKSARDKLLAALPLGSAREASRIAARFHLDPLDWYRTAEPAPHLPVLARAVLDQAQVAINYESWAGQRDRFVNPLGLVIKAGSWYLVGAVGDDIRTYKVANIRSLVAHNTPFERPEGFDLASHWSQSLERFERSLRPLAARIRLSETGCARLARQGAFAADALAVAIPDSCQGWVIIDLPIESLEQAALMLLGIGPEVEIVAPDTLRALMHDLAGEIVALAA